MEQDHIDILLKDDSVQVVEGGSAIDIDRRKPLERYGEQLRKYREELEKQPEIFAEKPKREQLERELDRFVSSDHIRIANQLAEKIIPCSRKTVDKVASHLTKKRAELIKRIKFVLLLKKRAEEEEEEIKRNIQLSMLTNTRLGKAFGEILEELEEEFESEEEMIRLQKQIDKIASSKKRFEMEIDAENLLFGKLKDKMEVKNEKKEMGKNRRSKKPKEKGLA